MPPWQHRPTIREPVRELPKPTAEMTRTVVQSIRRRVGNLPVRVPAMDWPSVVTGQKRMFRCYSERGGDREIPVIPPETQCPRPCLLFAVRHNGPHRSRRWEAKLGVLLSHRQEPLGSISPEDLAAEGFEYINGFRWYWKQRYKKLGWRPWDVVSVIEVRTLRDPDDDMGADANWAARWLFDQMYQEWLV